MRDGVYLLALAGDDYAIPYTLKNQTNPDGTRFQLLAGVTGVLLVQNLAPGYRLIPLVAMTVERVAALEGVVNVAEFELRQGNWKHGNLKEGVETLRAVLAEVDGG